MNDKRKAVRLAGVAVVVLVAGCFLAVVAPRFQAGIVALSFVAYMVCTRRALTLCRIDELVLEPGRPETREQAAREALRSGLLAGSAGALSLGRSMNAMPRVARFAGPERRAFPRPLEGSR